MDFLWFFFCLLFVMPLCASVYMCLVVTCWERADLLALVYGVYTSARVFVLRIRVLCAFPTHCTCVEFKLRMKRESTYFETHEYSLAAPNAFQR